MSNRSCPKQDIFLILISFFHFAWVVHVPVLTGGSGGGGFGGGGFGGGGGGGGGWWFAPERRLRKSRKLRCHAKRAFQNLNSTTCTVNSVKLESMRWSHCVALGWKHDQWVHWKKMRCSTGVQHIACKIDQCGVPKHNVLLFTKFGSCISCCTHHDSPGVWFCLNVLQDVAGVFDVYWIQVVAWKIYRSMSTHDECSIVQVLQGALLDAVVHPCFNAFQTRCSFGTLCVCHRILSNNTSINQKSESWIRPWQLKGGTRTDQMRL